jgi:hypothetical protein
MSSREVTTDISLQVAGREASGYRCRAIGVSPDSVIIESASGDVRKRSSARAASGCLAALVIAPANDNPA